MKYYEGYFRYIVSSRRTEVNVIVLPLIELIGRLGGIVERHEYVGKVGFSKQLMGNPPPLSSEDFYFKFSMLPSSVIYLDQEIDYLDGIVYKIITVYPKNGRSTIVRLNRGMIVCPVVTAEF